MEYKDKTIQKTLLPKVNIRKRQSLSVGVSIVLLILFLLVLTRFDLLDIVEPSGEVSDDELRAKRVRFESDQRAVGNIPFGARYVTGEGDSLLDGKNKAVNSEEDIDRSIDSKVVGSISRDSQPHHHNGGDLPNQGHAANLQISKQIGGTVKEQNEGTKINKAKIDKPRRDLFNQNSLNEVKSEQPNNLKKEKNSELNEGVRILPIAPSDISTKVKTQSANLINQGKDNGLLLLKSQLED